MKAIACIPELQFLKCRWLILIQCTDIVLKFSFFEYEGGVMSGLPYEHHPVGTILWASLWTTHPRLLLCSCLFSIRLSAITLN